MFFGLDENLDRQNAERTKVSGGDIPLQIGCVKAGFSFFYCRC